MLVFIESTICLAIELIVRSWSEMRISDFVTRLDSRQQSWLLSALHLLISLRSVSAYRTIIGASLCGRLLPPAPLELVNKRLYERFYEPRDISVSRTLFYDIMNLLMNY